MHRLTARLLLLVALLGTFAPSALLALATPPHACCVRKAHRCHDSIDPDTELAIRDASCCNREASRAVTTAKWARPQPRTAQFFQRAAEPLARQLSPAAAHSQAIPLHSPRAPPSIA
jgi:hypothetical protein